MTKTTMTTSSKGESKMNAKGKTIKKLRKYRLDRGLTIYSLADKLGVNFSTVSYWETGEKFPRRQKLEELEDLFDVGYRELFKDLTQEEIEELDRYKNVENKRVDE
ncbi:putative XRE family transcriptional regulator 1 [Bacillus phage BSP36]|uniref:Putative XRE family transcriptional regulator 1 n=1 Tax=Bacillus phage BSP38 TaxID=2283013 RepID=A0A345MJS3_BPBSP|nr:transcriptional regulator [Bacillus phage BSP38]AXH71105.1 putative XRE family transcriptional regulator 1 [Bacillus phage BSP38]AYJ75149.1 putative XRE family transcriptional regulator 1 [Bacillus phage BSP36]